MQILDANPHLIVLDACVLISGVLRPTLLSLAAYGLFTPIWSDRLGDEWRRNAARIWSIPPEALDREWERMQLEFPCANVNNTGPYEAGLRYSDPKDWHVIATALAARARCGLPVRPEVTVLTWNLKDFNRGELRRQGLQVLDPDRLLGLWWPQYGPTIHRALRSTVGRLADEGRPRTGGLIEIIRRERLFRLARLIERDYASESSLEQNSYP